MTTIFDALTDDHDKQRELVAALVATSGDSEERRRIFDELRLELAAHARHEERHFYVPLMQHDLTQAKARHSVAEHQELDELIERLDGYDRTAPRWLQTAEELAHRLDHHLTEEEREVFPLAGKALAEAEKTDLAADYRAAMSTERDEQRSGV